LQNDQMLISKNLLPKPAERGGKAESYAPGPEGYQVYLSDRSEDEYWATVATSQRALGPAARPVGWDAATMRLEVSEGDPSPEWRLVNAEGRVVTVNVKAGSTRVVDEINAILAEIADELLP
jgi:hypothetical protein